MLPSRSLVTHLAPISVDAPSALNETVPIQHCATQSAIWTIAAVAEFKCAVAIALRYTSAGKGWILNNARRFSPAPACFDVVHRFQLIAWLQSFYHFFYDFDLR